MIKLRDALLGLAGWKRLVAAWLAGALLAAEIADTKAKGGNMQVGAFPDGLFHAVG